MTLEPGYDFKILEPIRITNTIETSSNLVSPQSEYNAGTTYDLGDLIFYEEIDPIYGGLIKFIYESIQGSNTGNTPNISPLWWKMVNTDNLVAYRDARTNTYSTRQSNILLGFTFVDQSINSFSFNGIVAETVNVVMNATIRENKLVNGFFTNDFYGWGVVDIGTGGGVEPFWSVGGTLSLDNGDGINYNTATQTIAGISGTKRVIRGKLNSSDGDAEILVNGVSILTLLSDSVEVIGTFLSDGNDLITLVPTTYLDVSNFDEVILQEVDTGNELLNGSFLTDILNWDDVSSGTGTISWDSGKFLKITRDVGSANRGIAKQIVSGISGEQRKIIVKVDSSSTGTVEVRVNGVTLGAVAIGSEEEFTFISDGEDLILLLNNLDNSIAYVDYAILNTETVYDETYNVLDKNVLFKDDLPEYQNHVLTFSIDKVGAHVKVNELSVGNIQEIGVTQKGINYGINDFSKKDVDDDTGIATLDQRGFSKTTDFIVAFNPIDFVDIYEYLSSIRATPVVFIGNEDKEESIIFGFYKDFLLTSDYDTMATGTIEVEELS